MVEGLASFGESWRAIVQHLQQAADTNNWPVEPDQIMAGDWQGEGAVSTPAVVIYMVPGKKFDAQNIYSKVATCSLFVLVDGENDITESTDGAVGLAWKIVDALATLPITVRWSNRDKVLLDTVYGDFVVAQVEFEIWYK